MAKFKELPYLGLTGRERKAIGLMIKHGMTVYIDPYEGSQITISLFCKIGRFWRFDIEHSGGVPRTVTVKVAKRYKE